MPPKMDRARSIPIAPPAKGNTSRINELVAESSRSGFLEQRKKSIAKTRDATTFTPIK